MSEVLDYLWCKNITHSYTFFFPARRALSRVQAIGSKLACQNCVSSVFRGSLYKSSPLKSHRQVQLSKHSFLKPWLIHQKKIRCETLQLWQPWSQRFQEVARVANATVQSTLGDGPMPSGSLVTFIPQSDSICSARLGLLELRHFAKILDFSVAISCPNPMLCSW